MTGFQNAAQMIGMAAASVAPMSNAMASPGNWVVAATPNARNSTCSPGTVTANIMVLRERFAALRTLADGWDGPHSIAPNREVVARAAYLLDRIMRPVAHVAAPVIAPVADGGIQAEWHLPGHRLEGYFEPDGTIAAWSENREARVEFEEEGEAAIQMMIDWITAREYELLA